MNTTQTLEEGKAINAEALMTLLRHMPTAEDFISFLVFESRGGNVH